jgi:hypothetical protein
MNRDEAKRLVKLIDSIDVDPLGISSNFNAISKFSSGFVIESKWKHSEYATDHSPTFFKGYQYRVKLPMKEYTMSDLREIFGDEFTIVTELT